MEKHIHEQLVREIIKVGESLIKNAESIAGTEEGLKDLSLYIDFPSINADVMKIWSSRIDINRSYEPDGSGKKKD